MTCIGKPKTIRKASSVEIKERDERYKAIASYRSRKKLNEILRRADRIAQKAQFNVSECREDEGQFNLLEFVRTWNSVLVQQAIVGIGVEEKLRLRDLLMATMKGQSPSAVWRKAILALVDKN